jgi:protein-export membrane protein SecD
MNIRPLWKLSIILAVLAFAFYQLYPNAVWYSLPLAERQAQAKRKNPLVEKVIPLGLDLQGGAHLVYQLDTSKLPDESADTIRQAIDQNILVINNRVDGLGVANAFVARQGRDFIVIQMPGVYESEQAKQLIGQTALLEFRIVVSNDALVQIIQKINEKGLQPEDVIHNRLPDDIKKMLPAGTEILPSRDGGYLLVKDKADLTGKYLKQARVELGNSAQVGGLSIGFELDPEGAQLFEALTSSHINERLAIVLDRQIQSAPNIQTRIPGGHGQITGSFSPEEAKKLANVLNSGNLQAPMKIVEERVVGPELGEDSIRSGIKAMGIGFLMVVLFVALYYKFSGLLADIALLMNFVLLMWGMSMIKATLTMPGIAGIILSLAMAVDANVIILERVREELRKGKDVRLAVSEGYDKAFWAIFDGNITTLFAAAFLFQFGTGPVKGFGITLAIGLIVSMFTAVYVTRIFYEVWFESAKPKTLSV